MQSNSKYFLVRSLLIVGFLLNPLFYKAQIANYVNNGGFEVCANPDAIFKKPKYWDGIDTNKFSGYLFSRILSPYWVPKNGSYYQWPRHGDNYLGSTPYCSTCSYNTRGYPRNKLKANLELGKTYCLSMYVNLTNPSSYAISSLGAYFGDSSTDTIKQCTIPLTFLTPQIQNLAGNFITDTLNWVLIRGLYTANGTEKYLMLGNFNNDANTDTLFVSPEILPQKGCSYLFDDVSCIDIDLPAFAGDDVAVVPGDSIYLGRESDIGIDEACLWFKLPTVITSTTPAIDTIAGFWIKPTTTETYVVRQDICGNIKWDTVVIYINPVGIEKLKILNEELKVYPVPASNFIELKVSNANVLIDFRTLSIFNKFGQLVREEEFNVSENQKVKTEELSNGIYFLQLKSGTNEIINKRFVISR